MHASHPIRRGLRWSIASVAWTTVACTAAVGVGVAVHSLSVVAFGCVGIVDVAGSVALVSHFRHGVAQGLVSDRRDRLVTLLVAAGMLIIAIVTTVVAVARLIHGSGGPHGLIGAVVAMPSAVVLAVLAVGKRRSGRAIPSAALVADGNVSALGAVFAFIAVAGVAAEAAGHVWWLDPVCSVVIAAGAAIAATTVITRSDGWSGAVRSLALASNRLAGLVYPYRRATGWLAWVGAAIAGVTAPRAWIRLGVRGAAPFLAVALVLFAFGVACRRGSRGVLVIAGAGLAGQILGVAGATAQLILNPGDAKAAELRTLGLNPRLGWAVNVAYSACGCALFARMWHRARQLRRFGGTPFG